MTLDARALAISIAGLGDPAGGTSLRLSWLGATVGSATYVDILVSPPAQISSSVDPLEATLTQSAISFELAHLTRTDLHGDHVRDFLFNSRPDTVAMLHTALTAAGTSVELVVLPGRTSPATGNIIYLGREAMRVTGYSAGTGSGGSDVATVTRGVFGTTAVAHAIGDTDDRRVYTDNVSAGSGNPIVEGREVWLYELDIAAGTESIIWRGYLERPSECAGIASLSARDSWSMTAGRKVGMGAFWTAGEIQRHTGGAFIKPGYSGSRITPTILIEGERMVVTDGECLVAAYVLDDFGDGSRLILYSQPSQNDGDTPYYEPLFGTAPEAEFDLLADATDKLYEVLLADKSSNLSHFGYGATPTESDHPFDIIRNIWCSTGEATWTTTPTRTKGSNGDFDWLPKAFGLGIDDSLIDHTGIDALRDSPQYANLRMRNLILNREGKPEKAEDITGRILASCFAFPALTSGGLLTIRSLIDPGPGNVDATLGEAQIAVDPTNPMGSAPKRMESSFPVVRDMIVNLARRGVDGDYAERLDQVDFQDTQSARYPAIAEDIEIDAGDFGDPDSHDASQVISGAHGSLLALFSYRFRLQTDPLPEYEFEVRPSVGWLPAGSVIDLTHPAILGPDAARGVTSHRCIVLESSRDFVSWRQSVRVLDLYPVTKSDKTIAPSWRISSVSSNTQFVVYATEFSADDRGDWIDGASYDLWTRDGQLRSTDGPTTGSISAGTVTLDAAWTAAATPVTPSANDIVRVAKYDNAGSDWSDRAYIADSNGQLGTANDTAHRWGV